MKIRLLASVAILTATSAVALAQTPVYLDNSKPVEQRIEDALSRMTFAEKVGLCTGQAKFSSRGVPRLGIPDLWMDDGPHGVRAEVNWSNWKYAGWTNDSITAFPALSALAATWNPEMSALYGKALGEEALYRGKDVMLGPGVNIYRTPLNGRNFEYMGEDPYLAGEMAVPYIVEMQRCGVSPCIKHFALNNQETRRQFINVIVSDRALYEIYLPAFKKAVDAGVWSVMGSYNKAYNEWCCHNKRLLCDILRGEWGFDGCVISDWGGTHETYQAAMNGLDIEMGTHTDGMVKESTEPFDAFYLAYPYRKAVLEGQIPDSTVEAKARNIMRLFYRTAMNRNRGFGSIASEEHYAAAKQIADESIVILKNNGILPIAPGKYGKILVVGENATKDLTAGGGSSELKPKDMYTPLDEIRKIYGSDVVDYAKGYMSGRYEYHVEHKIPQEIQDSLRRQAVDMARQADIVIYIGGLNKNSFQDCEGDDRYSYDLPFGQNRLIEEIIAVNPNIVIANVTGNGYAMPWADKVPAIVQSWYLGTMIGRSMADVLSGRVNPSGKMPFSVPYKLEDCGAHQLGERSYPGLDIESDNPYQEYLDDILVGYRWYDTKKIPARYAFGHGLSYTTFAYGKPTVSSKSMTDGETIEIVVPVTNSGKIAGKEIVQLYISDEKASVLRPVKELKGFRKVMIEPGQTVDVAFTVKSDDLKFFDEKSHSWVAEPGKFKALIGASSTDIRQTVPFNYE